MRGVLKLCYKKKKACGKGDITAAIFEEFHSALSPEEEDSLGNEANSDPRGCKSTWFPCPYSAAREGLGLFTLFLGGLWFSIYFSVSH